MYSILLAVFSIITLKAFPFAPIQITLYDFLIEGYPSFILSFEPNKERIRGAFLPAVIRRSLPYAAIILIHAILIAWCSPWIGIPTAAAMAVTYGIAGFAGILALIKACRPFNKLRMLICSTVVIGFYAAVLLFSSMIELESFTVASFVLFAGLVTISLPLTRIVSHWISEYPLEKIAWFQK